MRNKLLAILAIAAVAPLAACAASHRYLVNEPVQKKFGSFRTVEVTSFSSNIESEKAKRVAEEFADELVSELREATRDGGTRLFSAVTPSTNETDRVLTISGKVLSFDEGNRAKRYLIGLGAGKAYATVQCTFTDKSTGETIAVGTFEGELSGGFFGGSSSGASKGVIKSIKEFVKDNY